MSAEQHDWSPPVKAPAPEEAGEQLQGHLTKSDAVAIGHFVHKAKEAHNKADEVGDEDIEAAEEHAHLTRSDAVAIGHFVHEAKEAYHDAENVADEEIEAERATVDPASVLQTEGRPGPAGRMAVTYAALKAQYDEFAAVLSDADRMELEADLVAVQRLEAEAELFRLLEPLLLRHRDLFNEIDRNSDGSVTVDKLLGAFERKRIRLGHERVRELFQVLDTNGDGSIEIDEFMEQMRKAKIAMRQVEADRLPRRAQGLPVPGASNVNRRRFPGLAKTVHSSMSAPDLTMPSADLSVHGERSVSRHAPPLFIPGQQSSVTGELSEFTNVWVAKQLEAERQRRGALSQVRHAVLHKSTHVDLAPADMGDSAEGRRKRAQRRRSHGVGLVGGKRQIWSPANPAKAKTGIMLKGSIISGNARSEYDALKDQEFTRDQDARRRWIDGDMVPPDGRPKDIHNPLTLMSADMPTLMCLLRPIHTPQNPQIHCCFSVHFMMCVFPGAGTIGFIRQIGHGSTPQG